MVGAAVGKRCKGLEQMAYVSFKHVSFHYPVYNASSRSLKVAMMRHVAGGRLTKGEGGTVNVQALQDVSFELQAGDRLGLIGSNGSGKSTLLRVLAGLAHPQGGEVTVNGRVVPLIEKGLGINVELTGNENIELPLRLLGATTEEVRRAKQEIPELTGLGPFMNLPVRTYSEGMKARLAFSLCTAVHGDVLVLDEWLGAGDIEFYERAQDRLMNMWRNSGVVVLASHSNALISQMCNRAAWMDSGKLVMFGDAESVLDAYLRAAHSAAPEKISAE